ncbi:MAG: haloacid dehalogenase [Candidatus Rokuibacteriota bacterium]|nr:MAG: haloacid dehalogenase [Candidatus Rokubacteria bacterium]
MTDRPYDVITFDCYGTLIDWEGGIRRAFSALAAATGVLLDPQAALKLYAEVEATVEAEAYRSYRAILAETARRIAARLRMVLPSSHAGFLAESLPNWPPFPDTNPALRRLADAGYALGILSNIDDDLLSWTRHHLEAGFEFAVTAQQTGSYKPAPAHFTMARERIGGRRWLHAAQSYFHDVAPACALHIPVAWINRNAETPGHGGPPDREFRNLAGLADWLAP